MNCDTVCTGIHNEQYVRVKKNTSWESWIKKYLNFYIAGAEDLSRFK